MSTLHKTNLLIKLLEKPWPVFAFALGVRVVVVTMGYSGDPQDTPEYDEIAHNLLTGRGFVASEWWHGFEVWSWRAPFYPFFLAGVYGLFGYSHLAVRLCQCVVGALTAMLVMVLGKKLDSRIASICGGLAIFYGPLAAMSNEVMTETWFTFWGVLSAYFLVSGQTLGGGIALGAGILTRPIGLFYVVALGIIGVVRRRWWGRKLWAIGIAFLVIFPWTVRNYKVHGVWPMLSSQGGFIVARSNAVDPDWRKPHGWGVAQSFLEQMPSEVERDRYWWREALSFVVSNPVIYFQLVIERFLRFWYFFRPSYNFWLMSIVPLFLFGVYRFWRVGNYLLPALYIAVSTLSFITVLYGSGRFRLSLMPFFLIFASVGLRQIIDDWGSRRAGWLVSGLVGGNLLIALQAEPLRAVLLNILYGLNLK